MSFPKRKRRIRNPYEERKGFEGNPETGTGSEGRVGNLRQGARRKMASEKKL